MIMKIIVINTNIIIIVSGLRSVREKSDFAGGHIHCYKCVYIYIYIYRERDRYIDR